MDDLIMALGILRRYMNEDTHAPTHCEHDELRVYVGVSPDNMEESDVSMLDDLGFHWDDEFESWLSYRFGSC